MRAVSVRVEPRTDGARLVARDWPGAPWVAVPCLAAGLPLLFWSAATVHVVEAGGAIVFCGLGAVAAWLALAKRRDLLLTRDAGAVRIRGREGAGPFARTVDVAFPPDSEFEVLGFDLPDGADDLPDRGGDLVLAGGGARLPLARRTGAGWRGDLDRAASLLRSALGKGDVPARVA